MSMLTAQVGKLRKRAAELRQGRWSDGADDAALMDDAADIIENLRDRLTEPWWTCRMDIIDTDERYDGDEDYLCECSACGSKSWEPAHDLPQYCRRCGRKFEVGL